MTLRSAAETCLYVSAGVPATFTEADFKLLTWTEVSGAPNMPEFGPIKTVSTFDDMCSGTVAKFTGATDNGGDSFDMSDIFADPGQIIMKAAFDAANGTPAQLIMVKVKEKGNDRAIVGQSFVTGWRPIHAGISDAVLRRTGFAFTSKPTAEFVDV